MKNLTKQKATMLSLLVIIGLIAPIAATAQRKDIFFHVEESYKSRDANLGGYNIGTQGFGSDVYGGYNITTQQFGNEAPLGEGLLIMLGAGAIYAALKKKKDIRL